MRRTALAPNMFHVFNVADYKRCYACKCLLPKDEFGLGQHICKECASFRSRLHYVMAPPAHRKVKSARHNSNQRGVLGSFTEEEWNNKLEEFNNCCAYCLVPLGDNATVDHIKPIANGGVNTIDNLVPACGSCNSRKYSKSLLQFVGGI